MGYRWGIFLIREGGIDHAYGFANLGREVGNDALGVDLDLLAVVLLPVEVPDPHDIVLGPPLHLGVHLHKQALNHRARHARFKRDLAHRDLIGAHAIGAPVREQVQEEELAVRTLVREPRIIPRAGIN